MNITLAKYLALKDGNNFAVQATIDGQELQVPLDTTNRHYNEIKKQVDAGDITIAAAD
tara:strand:+ start:390 stop:563 length:174 start_codon:yes stop_codon:yes gene_type:complete